MGKRTKNNEYTRSTENFGNLFTEKLYNEILKQQDFAVNKKTGEYMPITEDSKYSPPNYLVIEFFNGNGTRMVCIYDLIAVAFPYEWLELGYKKAKRRIVQKMMWNDIPEEDDI